MNLDVRLPMGLLFLILGVILVGYGFTVDPTVYANHSLGQNVNVFWGTIFAIFGAFMLFLFAKKILSCYCRKPRTSA